MNKSTETSNMNNEQQARRTLLKMATYVPPAILGVMIGGNKVAEAGAALGQPKTCGGGGTIIVSANGNACCPCVPTDPKFDPVKCAWKKCKLGNCPACRQYPPTKKDQCKKVAAACGCTCKKGNKKGGNKGIWTCK
ncbi:MAG: hypothetical protein Q9M21_06305 [Mariprofundaceae bacterium]|nr:hypothetical protein [Mariprofundaceae bacterium]